MIVNTTRIIVASGKREEFFQTINQLLGPIRASRGCFAFNVYVDSGDENASLLISEWDTEADLNNYLGSDDFHILHGAMAVLGTRIDESRAVIYSDSTEIADRQRFSLISLNDTSSYR